MKRRDYAYLIIIGISLVALLYIYWTSRTSLEGIENISSGSSSSFGSSSGSSYYSSGSSYYSSGSGSGSGDDADQAMSNEIDDLPDNELNTGL